MYKHFFKRAIDIFVSSLLLPFVLLIGIVVGILIIAEDRGDVFFRAPRRGRNGKIFKMYKFRSMYKDADELPQLINVLIGDMSLIGPRPITINRPLEDYDEKRKVRLEVRPGITGYSQAYFRNSISSEEKLEKDAWYARNVSFLLDAKIIIATIRSVLFRHNIYNSTNE